jgi:hypothetical protein
MKLIIDVPLMESTDLKGLQGAALVSLVWKTGDEHASRPHIAAVTSVEKFREPHRDLRDVAEIENLRQQLAYERYRLSSPPPARSGPPPGSRAPS